MVSIQTEFDEKVKHVNLYFDMLDKIVNKNAVLLFDADQSHVLDQELVKVLKANVFLLLYNLIESTIRKSTEYIHDLINNETCTYDDLRNETQRIWLEFKYNNFKDQSSRQIHEILNTISGDIVLVNYEEYINKRKANDLSGNVDSRSVKNLAEKYGFAANSRVQGSKIVQIKNRRNSLAHGNITFAECGKDYTYTDLRNFKRETEFFLIEFLKNIKKHTEEQLFRK